MSAYSLKEVGMFIRRSFNEFLKVQSDAVSAPAMARDWVIDWRWLYASGPERPTFPSERSLIDCAAWAKLKTQKPA